MTNVASSVLHLFGSIFEVDTELKCGHDFEDTSLQMLFSTAAAPHLLACPVTEGGAQDADWKRPQVSRCGSRMQPQSALKHHCLQ